MKVWPYIATLAALDRLKNNLPKLKAKVP